MLTFALLKCLFLVPFLLSSIVTAQDVSLEKQYGIDRVDNTGTIKDREPLIKETDKQNLLRQKKMQAEITLLYHQDREVRKKAILALAELRDPNLLDDLIRAYSIELCTDVCFVYKDILSSLAGVKIGQDRSAWKAWLAREVEKGRLKIDYITVDVKSLTPEEKSQMQPLASCLELDHFQEMTGLLTASDNEEIKFTDAMRFLVANDHRIEITQFLSGDWLDTLFTKHDIFFNSLAHCLNGLANPGPLRDAVENHIRVALRSENPVVVANALHLLAGEEAYSTVFTIPDVAEKVKELCGSPDAEVAKQAQRALTKISKIPKEVNPNISYEEAFRDLYETLGRDYPCFELKGIDWPTVGSEFLPRAGEVKTDKEFGLLCMELVACLQDSHAQLIDGTAKVPEFPMPRWDPGFACLEDDQKRPVVYYVDADSPAEKAGVKIGMVVLKINELDAAIAIENTMNEIKKYEGYSSDRYLRYHAYRFFTRQIEKRTMVKLEMLDHNDEIITYTLPATSNIRYFPRLPLPMAGINDSDDLSWKMLDHQIGYLHVRRLKENLTDSLDKAIDELKSAEALIVDVRGNSGGGFDSKLAHLNFALDKDTEQPERPRFKGPMALLIDSHCISAGEGWASWFMRNNRARAFGEATAGASSKKRLYTLRNGLYRIRFPIRAYTGYLDRPIEYLGLPPDVFVVQNREDLIQRRDTVLEMAKKYLLQEIK